MELISDTIGVMATRTLENPRHRLVTMLVTPLMSCGSRLPVYTLLIAAFSTHQVGGNVLFSIGSLRKKTI